MAVYTDERGRLVVTSHPATQGLHGRIYVRREPEQDPGDTVRALGAFQIGDERSGITTEVVVEAVEFGAVPAGQPWNGASSTSFDLAGFAAIYRPAHDAEASLLALASAAESEAATKASAKRTSPWTVTS